MIYVFTSCALNYTPKAKILMRCFQRYAPGLKFCLGLADRKRGARAELMAHFDDVVGIEDLDEINHDQWIFGHNIVELSTAIKPFVMREILARDDCEAVMYFDPDMVLFSDLTELVADLKSHDIILTPHLTHPETSRRGIEDNELSALRHGVYNLGFIGVRNTHEGRRFANWWSDRLKDYCREDIPAGIFTDQRWIDLVPAFFANTKVLRHPGYNVASWNLNNRMIVHDDDGRYLVNGEQLVFYHFTGFDSGAHSVMSNVYSNGSPVIRELLDWYTEQIRMLADDSLAQMPWAFANYSDGKPIGALERSAYRDRVDLKEAFPKPFDSGSQRGESFQKWWLTNGAHEYERQSEHPEIQYIEEPQPVVRGLWRRLASAGFRFVTNPEYRRVLSKNLLETFHAWGLRGLLGLILAERARVETAHRNGAEKVG